MLGLGLFLFPMLALSWNVRGLGKLEKRHRVKKVVLSQKLAVFFIQESKLGSVDSRIIKGLRGVVLTRGISVEAEGSIGGLLTLWNEELVTIKDYIPCKWCIILVGVLNK